MTLDKHKLEGIPQIKEKTLHIDNFEIQLSEAGYLRRGEAPARGNRIKIWWRHKIHRRIESIYSNDGKVAITAYHVD